MKKYLLFFFLLLLLAAFPAQGAAEHFLLDGNALMTGMDGVTWYQGYTPTEQYGSYSICLPIRCDDASGSITAALTLDDPNLLVFQNTPQPVTVLPQNGLYPLRFSIPLAKNRKNGDYAAHVSLTGQTAEGEAVTESIPLVLRIRQGAADSQPLRPEMTLSGQLRVGEECTLRLSIRNVSPLASLCNGELTLTDRTGDVLMAGVNCLPLSEILPGETAEVEVPVTVRGNAAVEMHSLAVKLTCQVLEQEQVWENVISHPVSQDIRLELGSISLPDSVVQGDIANLTVPLMNMGKGELCNAMVTLDFPELAIRQSVLAGTIQPGETGQAKLTFTPGKNAPGDYSGRIQVSCEDRYGNTQQQTIPVSLTVEEAKPIVLGETPEKKAAAPGWLLPALASGCGLLLVGLVLQGSLLRSRIRKLEEEKL